MHKAQIVAVCSSKHKGTPKKNIGSGEFKVGLGLLGDAHGGDWHRQVSLLAMEQIEKMREKGLDLQPGSFAENLTTEFFDLWSVKIGDKIKVGDDTVLEITQIGKECHSKCAIFHKIGDCIMPKQGVFAVVLQGGEIKTGDAIVYL
jgi:MOSC domain-containing protein YiiM